MIIRNQPYLLVSERTLEDDRLSFEALGLLLFLASLDDGTLFNSVNEIAKSHNADPDSVTDAFYLLVDCGYITRDSFNSYTINTEVVQ